VATGGGRDRGERLRRLVVRARRRRAERPVVTGMRAVDFALALAIGAAVLALWVDLRLERRRPASPTTRVAHALAAYMVLRVTAPASQSLAGSSTAPARVLAVVFLVVLPGLVYAFLAGLWLMRTLAEVARLSRP
jgi:hypothetical protein